MPARITMGRARLGAFGGSMMSPTEAGYVQYMRGQAKVMADKLNDIIDGVKDATPEAIMHALKESKIPERSQELVPVDTGALKKSFFMSADKRVGGVVVYIGYGRYGQPWYAALVHENMFFRHAKGKSAKFLEIAINENSDRFRSELRYAMQFGLQKMGNKYG